VQIEDQERLPSFRAESFVLFAIQKYND